MATKRKRKEWILSILYINISGITLTLKFDVTQTQIQALMWTLEGCSHGTITIVIFLLQQMGCMGFNISVHTMRLQQQDKISNSPLVVRNKSQSKSHHVNGP